MVASSKDLFFSHTVRAFDEPVLFQEALFILALSVYCMCEWINPFKTFIVPQGNAVGS